jgi:hypothetical protein
VKLRVLDIARAARAKGPAGMATHMNDLADFFFRLKQIPGKPWLVSTSGGKFVTRRFQTFATKSAKNGLMHCNKTTALRVHNLTRAAG